jgi:tol-pal system protein YbgF
MINCKKHLIATGFMLLFPLTIWAEAPVVDERDNFAIIDGRQGHEAPVVDSQYNDSQFEIAQNDHYLDGDQGEEGAALAKDDQTNSEPNKTNSAALIDKIQSLQQELQELRGQLEVQAHDLKLLQQQQLAFYKDLDSRLSNSAPALGKARVPSTEEPKVSISTSQTLQTPKETVNTPATIIPVSRVNPADEQISYLAAYELVKNRRFDEALSAMNQFVQKYPKGGYTANAQYWLGELYLVKKDYAKAVAHFNIVLQQFPTSSKSAASMLKVGYAYATLGNKSEAKKYLQQVVRAYPNTPTAQLASSKLRTI